MTSSFVCAALNLGRKKSTGTEPDLVAQFLANSLHKLKVPGSNPAVDKNLYFVNLRLRSSPVE